MEGENRACTYANERNPIERDTSVKGHRRDNFLCKGILLVRGNRIEKFKH